MLEYATSETDLDRIVRIFDGANLIVHGLDGVIQRWTSGCTRAWTSSSAELRPPGCTGRVGGTRTRSMKGSETEQ